MECPICLDYIKNSCFGSCYHHFCFKCLTKWCCTNYSCPVCKIFINQILYDKEFDLINEELRNLKNLNDSNVSNSIVVNTNTDISNILNLTICFNDNIDKKLILTLKNNKGPGVYIYKINNNCRSYHYGLRKNDIILFINNIPCYNHKQSIELFDNCQLFSKDIKCKILRK